MKPVCSKLKSALIPLLGIVWLLFLTGSTAHAVVISESEIRQAVEAHVREQLKNILDTEDQDNVTVRIVKVPGGPFEFPNDEGNDPATIRLTTESALSTLYSERSVVAVHMQSRSGKHREIGVPVQIVVKKPVWVVKTAIPAKTPLSVKDLKLETREVSHHYPYAVGKERDLRKYISRVNLRPGEILDIRKIIIPPDVTNNSEVRILISNGNGMMLTVPGVALSDGRIGETIRVRQSLYKRRSFVAKIIDKNRVLVEM